MIISPAPLRQKKVKETVSLAAYQQVMWERDVALAQLDEAGVSLGEDAPIIRVDRLFEIIQKAKDAQKVSRWHKDRKKEDIWNEGRKDFAADVKEAVLEATQIIGG